MRMLCCCLRRCLSPTASTASLPAPPAVACAHGKPARLACLTWPASHACLPRLLLPARWLPACAPGCLRCGSVQQVWLQYPPLHITHSVRAFAESTPDTAALRSDLEKKFRLYV